MENETLVQKKPHDNERKFIGMIKKNKKKNSNREETLSLHLMILPVVILLFIYSYLPMAGLVMAFQDFDITLGIRGFFESEWVGLDNFKRILNLQGSVQSLINTLIIAFWKIITMFFVPIIIALLLNEIKKAYVKRSIQTLIYLPHFLSWVILAGILKNLLATDGLINMLMVKLFAIEPIFFLGDPSIFRGLLVGSNLWQEVGFSTIVFLAAITGIDPTLYESAVVDGADRWKQTIHITLPGMKPIIILSAVLSLGGILNAGFDQVFNLLSVPVQSTGDIIDTFVYRLSIQGGQYSLGTAVGLFKSVVSCIFVSVSYWAAYKFANYEIF
jgi:putative aldouronate transport system permease protein